MLTFFTPFDVKMIQISTFPAAPSTERVPSLAERVASLRYSINLQLLNNRVPGLQKTVHTSFFEEQNLTLQIQEGFHVPYPILLMMMMERLYASGVF